MGEGQFDTNSNDYRERVTQSEGPDRFLPSRFAWVLEIITFGLEHAGPLL
jgi:hypothetical protein